MSRPRRLSGVRRVLRCRSALPCWPAARLSGPTIASRKWRCLRRYLEPSATGEASLDNWWEGFGDTQLTGLVERALRQNLDIAMASARIREARAQEDVAGAGASPQVAAEASVTRQRISENAIPAPPGSGGGGGAAVRTSGQEFTTWRTGFDASWELDLWGRNRREREAATARTSAAVWDRRDVEVTVAAEVAGAYLRLRTLQSQIANAQAELARQQRFEQLVEARARGGLVTGQDLEQQRSERSVAAAVIPTLQAQAKAEIHALGVLTGQTPDALANRLAAPTGQAPSPPAVLRRPAVGPAPPPPRHPCRRARAGGGDCRHRRCRRRPLSAHLADRRPGTRQHRTRLPARMGQPQLRSRRGARLADLRRRPPPRQHRGPQCPAGAGDDRLSQGGAGRAAGRRGCARPG